MGDTTTARSDPAPLDRKELDAAWRVVKRFAGVVVVSLAVAYATIGWSPVELPADSCRISRAEVSRAWCSFDRDGKNVERLVAKPTDDPNERARLAGWKPGTVVGICKNIEAVDPGGYACADVAEVVVRRAFAPGQEGAYALGSAGATKWASGLAAALAVALYLWILADPKRPGWTNMVRHETGAFSLSKIQAFLWIVGLLWMWHFHAFIRLFSGMPWLDAFSVTIPETVMAVLTSSIGTAIAAGVANNSPQPEVKKNVEPQGLIADLLINDGKIDILRAQAVILSSAAFVWYLSNLWNGIDGLRLSGQMELPAMSSVLALVFGTSLGGYLYSKFVPPKRV